MNTGDFLIVTIKLIAALFFGFFGYYLQIGFLVSYYKDRGEYNRTIKFTSAIISYLTYVSPLVLLYLYGNIKYLVNKNI